MNNSQEPRITQDILKGQVDLLYHQAPPGFIATLINSAILAIALWSVEPALEIILWCAAMVSITIGRAFLVTAYDKLRPQASEAGPWLTRFVVGAAFAGSAWGVAATLLFPHGSVPHQMVLLIVMAGMSAGGITFLSPVRIAYLVYTLPILVPLAVLLFLEGTQIHMFLGLLTLIYLGSLMVTSKHLNATLIAGMRLRYDKDLLLDDLAESQDELEHANAALSDKLHELTRKERELRDSYRFLSMIMDNASDAIFSLDAEGRFTHINQATIKITGYLRGELLGQPFAILFPKANRDRINRQLMQRLHEAKEIRNETVDIACADGSHKTLQYSVTPLRDDDKLSAIVGTAEDVTERIHAERLKDEFVSTVSHELRTPLTSIRGALSLIDSGMLATNQTQSANLIEIAQRNCDRLVFLINDLLDIQKLEAGKLNFYMEDIDLDRFIQNSIENNRTFAEQFGVKLQFAKRDPKLRVRVDPDRMEQVMANLLSNAAKFSPGGSTVEVTTCQIGNHARISVRDHGPGIPGEFRDRIFQKFAQADASDTRQRGGTGLGLSLAKGIVERMGGKIDFITKEHDGSTFFIDIPLAGTVRLSGEPFMDDSR